MNSILTVEKFLELSNQSEIRITKEDITGRSRIAPVAIAREAYWYCLNLQGVGYSEISRLDGRSRTTVMSGIRTVRNLIETSEQVSPSI